jgi:hypothetical protein
MKDLQKKNFCNVQANNVMAMQTLYMAFNLMAINAVRISVVSIVKFHLERDEHSYRFCIV